MKEKFTVPAWVLITLASAGGILMIFRTVAAYFNGKLAEVPFAEFIGGPILLLVVFRILFPKKNIRNNSKRDEQ